MSEQLARMALRWAVGCLLHLRSTFETSASRLGSSRCLPSKRISEYESERLVKRRICESCLYFESAGFAKNGWCHHPSRRQNSDVRLMVRSNELGCRNGWNADLWVPSDSESSSQPSKPLQNIGGRAALEVAPAEPSDLITSIVAAKTDNASLPHSRLAAPIAKSGVEEDIFVNQKPSLSWNAPSSGPILPQPATELVQNPKAAILRARDQYRQRRKSEGRLADQHLAEPSSRFLASSREASLVHEHDLIEPRPEPEAVDPRYENRPLLQQRQAPSFENSRPVSPVSLKEIERPFPSLTDFPEDRARFESVPFLVEDSGGIGAPEAVQDDTWIETRQVDAVLPEPYVVDDFFEEEEFAIDGDSARHEEVELSVRHRESHLDRFLRQRKERRHQTDFLRESYEQDAEPVMYAAGAADSNAFVSSDWGPELIQKQDRNLGDEPEMAGRPSIAYSDDQSAARSPLAAPEAASYQEDRHTEGRVSTQQAATEEDDLMIPPPLPEFDRARHQAFQTLNSRTRLKPEPDRARPRSSSAHREQPIADEFGDQPLFASHPLPAAEDIEIDAAYVRSERLAHVSLRMERVCQTCRDFRPSDDGERGWCNNKWAFNHRRMVDADDLACRNSLGSWWTPRDESWRRDSDISRHAQQTPRVDQWLLGNREGEETRRKSGS